MKAFIFACIALFLASANAEECKKVMDIPCEWADMNNACIVKTREQIQTEIGASMQYLAMGAHFSQDIVNRPGFAHLFFEAASEERQHAIKLISYLLMRGELTSSVSNLIKNIKPKKTEWTSGVAALKDALELETSVTKSIRNLIKVCEDAPGYNDYHLVDYLTGDFLEEQYHGQRDLAGKISQLQKMMATYGDIGEFLYDKKLLN